MRLTPEHAQNQLAFGHSALVAKSKIGPIAAPRIVARLTHARLHGVLVNIAKHCQKLALVLDRLAFKAALEKVSHTIVALVEEESVRGVCHTHQLRELTERHLHQQVNMVVQKAPCKQVPVTRPQLLAKNGEICPPVPVILENELPADPSSHDVIHV